MILLENSEVLGWEHTIRGMRNPMNSWDKSDTMFFSDDLESYHNINGDIRPYNGHPFGDTDEFEIGSNDKELMMKLAKGGPVHAKYRRMITVYVDITAPLYWWKEFDTYKVGTVANSCSTMHKIQAKEFVWEDFSFEHLTNFGGWKGENGKFDEDCAQFAHAKVMGLVIDSLNGARARYLDYTSRGKDWDTRAKDAWWQMIQLLPSSYNQKRTVMMNYEVLVGIYKHRKEHKLDEWRELCKWIEKLPYSEIIIGGNK